MTGMEAAIASGILKVAGDKLASLLASEFSAITGATEDLLELKESHEEITSWLSAVRGLPVENDPQNSWIMKLRCIAYNIDDLLCKVHLEAEKHKIASGSGMHAIADSVLAKPRSFLYRCKVAKKIKKIKVAVAAIAKQRSDMNPIGQSMPQSQSILSRNRANVELSLLTNVEESQIPKRDQEKVQIISKLLESNEGGDGWIVSVVGLGGSGKTTLAKHICHDDKIKGQFKDNIYWVHVSQEFDVAKLIGKVFEAITKEKPDRHAPQHMVDEILKTLSGEKFLLVLDDAWHQDKEDWNKFMVDLSLRSGKAGSKLLITTRDQKVAEALKSEHIFNLAYLSEAESWSLFLTKSGWKEEDLGTEFIQFGKEIVNKCGGIPLAINTVGGILSEKREISTWRAINQSDIWNENTIERRVFASLKLSYIHLEDQLKQCFTFCSIFPKGYIIDKKRLIEQWIANGFIKQMMGEQPEVIGREYFDLLVKVGFLQDLGESEFGRIKGYKMHDLIHDLTRDILKSEVVTSLSDNVTKNCTQNCRYLSLTSCSDKVERVSFDKVRALYVSEGNISSDKLIKKSCYICSIVLDCASSTPFPQFILKRTPFPQFILKLDCLGYLEMHNVTCKKLPEAISGCWNLQSLHFIGCNGFVALPKSIGKLKKLRTLELLETHDLESLPQSIGECQDLQSLEIQLCRRFREIPNTIGNLRKLRTLELTDTEHLESLPQSIGDCQDLQSLEIRRCKMFREIPNTIGKLKKLRTLELTYTEHLESLPRSIGDCRDLQSLEIRHCEGFREIPNTIGKNENLRVLEIVGCRNLLQLPSEVIGEFGSIQTINLAESTGLTKLPEWVTLISTLEHIDLEGCRDLVELPRGIGSLTRLEVLNLEGCRSLAWMPSGFAQLTRLKRLGLYVVGHGEHDAKISDLENLDMLSGDMELKNLPHLMDSRDAEKACLKKKKNIQSLGLSWSESVMEEEEFVSNLRVLDALEPPSEIKELEIKGYRGFHLPCWMSRQSDSSCLETALLCQTSQPRFLCLVELRLYRLPNLEHMQRILVLPSLKTLLLWDMPKLKVLWTTTSGLGIGEEEVSGQYCFPVLSRLEVHRCPKLIMKPYFPPSLEVLYLEGCNNQILSLGRSSFPHADEPLSSSRAFDAVPLLKKLELGGIPESIGGLTSLWELRIKDCPALTALPEAFQRLTSLWSLRIEGCPALTALPEAIQHLTSLREVWIKDCPTLTALPEAIQHLTSLQSLWIKDCPTLTALPEAIQHLTSLQSLLIEDCPTLTALPEAIQHLTSLQSLLIEDCPTLTALPEAIQHLTSLKLLLIMDCPTLTALPEAIQHLSSLEVLCIEDCPTLTALPEAIQHLTSLRELWIEGCPTLTAVPEALRGRRVGDDWHHLLSRIPFSPAFQM